jgi:O-antigen/teichoic acid export membrane protein
MRELIALGAHFGVQQIQLTVFVALPQMIISTTLGAASVTPYNLALRLFNVFGIIQNAFMRPLWPAYSEAKAKREFAWIRRALLRSLAATLACTLVPMVLGAAFAPRILTLWVGPSAALPSTTLIWLMFAWNALTFLGQPFGYMLAGVSEVRRLTQYSVLSGVLSAILMVVLARSHGAEGVVAGMLLGFLPWLIGGNVVEALRVLRRFPRERKPEPELLEPARAIDDRVQEPAHS